MDIGEEGDIACHELHGCADELLWRKGLQIFLVKEKISIEIIVYEEKNIISK